MLIRFTCPAGHKIKADARFVGRILACPACRRPTAVPRAVSEAITESAAVRLLNDCDGEPQAREHDWRPAGLARFRLTKPCPRCKAAVPAAAEFCTSCRVRLFPSTRAWKDVCQAAAECATIHSTQSH